MSRRQKHPLRDLAPEELQELERVSRASSESAARVARAKALLAVSQGDSYRAAAQVSGRRSGDAVAHLVERFNRKQLRDLLVTRQDFFRDLRTLTRYLWFSDWDALFDFMLTEGANST